MAKPKEVTKSHCNRCGQKTNHHVLYTERRNGTDEIEGWGDASWSDQYQLLSCAGCDAVSMKRIDWFEPTDETTVTIYPPPVARKKPSWLGSLPTEVERLMKEVYSALDANSRALSMMGARAVVDMVLVAQVGDSGGFAAKLRLAEEAGTLSKKNREVLEAALDAGSAAAHRGHRARAEDVHAVIDIVENLLQAEYHLKSLADRLRETTPVRAKK